MTFRGNQKQESNFQQVSDLVTRNISVFLFIASRALFQSYAEFNTFVKRISLHVIPSRIIVSCYECGPTSNEVMGNLKITTEKMFRWFSFNNFKPNASKCYLEETVIISLYYKETN